MAFSPLFSRWTTVRVGSKPKHSHSKVFLSHVFSHAAQHPSFLEWPDMIAWDKWHRKASLQGWGLEHPHALRMYSLVSCKKTENIANILQKGWGARCQMGYSLSKKFSVIWAQKINPTSTTKIRKAKKNPKGDLEVADRAWKALTMAVFRILHKKQFGEHPFPYWQVCPALHSY